MLVNVLSMTPQEVRVLSMRLGCLQEWKPDPGTGNRLVFWALAAMRGKRFASEWEVRCSNR